MQETRPDDLSDDEARRQQKMRQEFFSGSIQKELDEAMENRLGELKGETLVRRVRIGRNDICPCGSGRKFKKCCISKIR